MKIRWLIPALAAVAIGALSYGLARWAVCSRCQPAPDRLEDVSFLKQELGLSAAQTRDIRQLQRALGAKLTDCCERHCAARARLAKALGNETNGATRAQALVAEMCRVHEESELATLAHIQRLHAILNQEQKRRFDELISECLCQSCPKCGGRRATSSPGPHPD